MKDLLNLFNQQRTVIDFDASREEHARSDVGNAERPRHLRVRVASLILEDELLHVLVHGQIGQDRAFAPVVTAGRHDSSAAAQKSDRRHQQNKLKYHRTADPAK